MCFFINTLNNKVKQRSRSCNFKAVIGVKYCGIPATIII